MIANEDVDGIHVLNKNYLKFTITETDGSFRILVKEGDTLKITSLRYQIKEILIDKRILDKGTLEVKLEEKVNELDEVVVGKILIGSLSSDLANLKLKQDINFYDLGIPGNTDLPLTKNEQRLFDADHGKFLYFYGIGFAINIHKILNRINGDTKMYKERIEFERQQVNLKRVIKAYEKGIEDLDNLPEYRRNEFFDFCLEDDELMSVLNSDNDLIVIESISDKLNIFKERIAKSN